MPDLNALLAPRSVAVIGASGNPDSIRGSFMKTILRHGFAGPIYPVSRSAAEVYGHPTYKHIAEVPGPVDRAVLLVPAEACPAALAD